MIIVPTAGKTVKQAQRAVNRFFRSNDLNVTTSFTPVKSEHVLNLSPTERVKMLLSEDDFRYVKEVKSDGKWIPQDLISKRGTLAETENSFIEAVKSLKSLCTKNIK